MGIVVPQRAQRVIELLEREGFEAYMVGGAVRDCLLGLPAGDVDITTSATAYQSTRCLEDAGLTVHPTGIDHGTVTAVLDGEPFEITTFRVDGDYSDARHPDQVRFSTSIEEDLARRDFTINAMAYNDKTGLVDPYGGRDDLANRLIRCVGDPDTRFGEDALRIMRALRFAARLGFAIEPQSSASLLRNRKLLLKISTERIGKELEGIVCGEHAADVLEAYTPVIEVVIPEITPLIGLDQHSSLHIYDCWKHTLVTLASLRSSEPVMRMAALFHDVGKPVVEDPSKGKMRFAGHGEASAELCTGILRRLHFPRSYITECAAIIGAHDLRFDDNDYSVRKWMSVLQPALFLKVLELKRADMCAHGPKAAEWVPFIDAIADRAHRVLDANDCIAVQDLAIDGNDVIAAGVEPGPEVGEVLSWLLDQVMSDQCPNERTALLDLLDSRA